MAAAIWDLVWAGHLSNDTIAPLRALLAGGGGAHKAKAAPGRSRYRRPGRPVALSGPAAAAGVARGGPPGMTGRWYPLPERDLDPTRRAAAIADALLDRHGVVTRGAVMAEGVVGGFAGVYPVLGRAGGARRRPGAATSSRVSARPSSRCRARSTGCARWPTPAAATGAMSRRRSCWPAPIRPTRTAPRCPGRTASSTRDRRPGRRAAGTGPAARRARWSWSSTALLVLYVERGGKTLLSYTDDPDVARAGRQGAGRRRARGRARHAVGGAGRRRLGRAGEPAARRADVGRLPGHAPGPAPARISHGATARAIDADGRSRRSPAVHPMEA